VSFGVSGQRSEAEIGLYFYNARFYDATLGRFTQADTIIPGAGNVLTLDRYAYTLNNPLRYNDPSGHWYGKPDDEKYIPSPPPHRVNHMVNLSTDLTKVNVGNAQAVIPSGNYEKIHSNLCPQLSFAVIYETVTGKTNTLSTIFDESVSIDENVSKKGDGMGPGNLVMLINSFDGWSARIDWRDGQITQNENYEYIKNILDRGGYIIFGNVLSTNRDYKYGRLVEKN